MADPRLRQISIKTGVLKRLTKEKTVYEREVDQQKARIEKLRAEGKDDHVLRKVSRKGDLLKFFDNFSFLVSCRKMKCCKNQ